MSSTSEIEVSEGYERSDVVIPYVVVFAIICLTTIIVGVIAVESFFVATKENLLREARRVPPIALLEQRALEYDQLTSYSMIDEAKGIYRIPVARAMSLLAEEAFAKDLSSRE